MTNTEETLKRNKIEAYFSGSMPWLAIVGGLFLVIGGAMIYWGGGAFKHVGWEILASAILYFILCNRSKVTACIFGGIIIAAGMGIIYSISNMHIGVTTIVVGAILIAGRLFSRKSVTDEDMDKFINEDMQQIEANAIKLLDFEEEALLTKPVVLTSTPNFLETTSYGSDKRAKIGDDGVIRFSPLNVTILYPCKKMVATYKATWDMLTGKAINENTDEYFYKDITSVSMKAESTQISKAEILQLKVENNEIGEKIKEELIKRAKKLPNEYEKLVIPGQCVMSMSTSGGDKNNVFLKNDEIAQIAGFTVRNIGEMEQGIQNLRKLIREKKSE